MTREDDYRRGREAISLLSGKRVRRPATLPVSSRMPSRRGPVLGALIAAAGVLVIVGVLSRLTPEAPQDMPFAGTATEAGARSAQEFTIAVAGPASGMEQVDLVDRRYEGWAAARAAVDFTLKEPSWTPPGFWLSALQSFVPDAPELELAPQSVVASFSGPDGSDAYYWIDQFAIARPDEFDIASTVPVAEAGIPHGVVQVAGLKALWSGGVMTLDAVGQQLGWDRSLTVLTWADGNVGYRLEARGLSLLDLVRVAESLQ